MQHFSYLSDEERVQLFYKEPQPFSKDSPKELLAYSLGAALYMPGTRDSIANDILSGKYLKGRHEGLSTIVICLEDSISDSEIDSAEWNLVHQIQELTQSVERGSFRQSEIPLLFIRVRTFKQVVVLLERLGDMARNLLCGFVFPKFTPENGRLFLETLEEMNNQYQLNLYAMPILESPEIIFKEKRMETLLEIKSILDSYTNILNVRIGATDFSGLFGIRRNKDTTIYDIAVIRDCISDIINIFGRSSSQYVISGPVWEYFQGGERILKPQIRQTPFEASYGRTGFNMRAEMIERFEDGLIHEVLLDKANGLVGKTIIHPSHIKVVQAMNVVTLEEYLDAMAILNQEENVNGVIKSHYSNKMNEIKPHYNWAQVVLRKSHIFGVLQDGQTFIDLLGVKREQNVYL
ncbi:HpcH/HpaI aldolase/citrate lyase family protein [Falsibacillus pallidus]|uniref:Citrate lyase beta subunit n=1 Tax=Falsibacillus pallidus TaxID=493781 RepID=A0A370GQH7_9BACI|nr:HpcH/HpaI aldolase/citrate lyase family protein [Falsibacillus pallidus]RDI45937.1 citrate lyase beta subunit [Falsibacillus pallidus]